MYTAQTMFAKSLAAYGDARTAKKINGNPKYKTNLAAIQTGVLDAAARNGLDLEDVVSGAKREVMSGYYGDFFKALNSGDDAKLEEMARKIARVNGSAKTALQSMVHRFSGTNRELTPALRERVEQSFR